MSHIPLLFGRFLVKMGWVTETQVQRAVQLQKELTLDSGLVAVLQGLLTVDDLRRVLLHQQHTGLLLQETVLQLGLLHEGQLALLEKHQHAYGIRLGEALVLHGSLTPDTLKDALQAFDHYKVSGSLTFRPTGETVHKGTGDSG